MSHFTRIKTSMKDLDMIKAAVAQAGATLIDASSYKINEDFGAGTSKPCMARIPKNSTFTAPDGTVYRNQWGDIGLIAQPDGSYTWGFDGWDLYGNGAGEHAQSDATRQSLPDVLSQYYALNTTMQALQQNGWAGGDNWEVQPDGTIKLNVTRWE